MRQIAYIGGAAGFAGDRTDAAGPLAEALALERGHALTFFNRGKTGKDRYPEIERIKGYRALLDEKSLGYEVTVFAMVHLSSQAEADLKQFEDFVRKEPLVRECWMLSGEIDFVLKCVAPDLKTFQAFVAELTGAPHVRNVKTSLTLRNSKDAAMVPMETKGK